jgi:NADPH:quinone reductase-like Zn-dependent oxidoreductase
MVQVLAAPAMRRAIVQDAGGKPSIVETPVPETLPGTIIVRTEAVALNPTDYKMAAAFPAPGAVIGQDLAGTVVTVGQDTETALQPGDKVCGLSPGSFAREPKHGAFATYVRAPAPLLMKVAPSAGLEAEEAATVGTALATCTLALWGPNALNLQPATPETPATAQEDKLPVLVYGGSTATGTIAIQLLRLSGLEPIATCSPANFDLVRAAGASAVFDYTRPDVVAAIREQAGGRLRHVLDCIADPQSVGICYEAIARVGGWYTSLEYVPDELQAKRRAVQASFVLGYEILGQEVNLSGGYYKVADPAKKELWIRFRDMYQRLLNEKKLRIHPTQIIQGGFEDILSGLDLLKSGSVSGRKLVVKLSYAGGDMETIG